MGNPSPTLERTGAAFATTQWTLLEGLGADDEATRKAAAERAARLYWPPVYACARHMVGSREEAAELTQSFFVDVVFGRRLLEQADASRGRLRSLLRTALKRYATDQWRRREARGGSSSVPLGDLDREDGLAIGHQSEDAFDRRWALALFHEALARCERHFMSGVGAKPAHWKLFESRVLRPAIQGVEARPLGVDGAEAGFGSPAAAAAAVQTVKRRFDVLFHEVVGETVDDPDEVEAEVRQVRALIARR